jgi:uncharacterized protein YjiS (DUF1127 family)
MTSTVSRLPLVAAGAMWAALCRRWGAWRARRQARRHALALEALDERTLHDLGFTLGELASVRAEAEGLVEATRLRVLQGLGRGWTA